MSKLKGLTIKKSAVYQEIDLYDLFGVDLTSHSDLKDRIGQAVIDAMIKRTEKGVDVYGAKFASYSKEYKDTLEFKAYGKTNKVNMHLRGDMLGKVDILNNSGNKIRIGWDEEKECLKAYNHNVGDTVPKRAFFGATQSQLEQIKDKFIEDVRGIKGEIEEQSKVSLTDLLFMGGTDAVESGASATSLLDFILGGDSE